MIHKKLWRWLMRFRRCNVTGGVRDGGQIVSSETAGTMQRQSDAACERVAFCRCLRCGEPRTVAAWDAGGGSSSARLRGLGPLGMIALTDTHDRRYRSSQGVKLLVDLERKGGTNSKNFCSIEREGRCSVV